MKKPCKECDAETIKKLRADIRRLVRNAGKLNHIARNITESRAFVERCRDFIGSIHADYPQFWDN